MLSSKKYICARSVRNALELCDLTEVDNPAHAIGLLLSEVLEGLVMRGWPAGQILRGPRIVSAQENYGLLGYDPAEVTLGSEHTRWVDEHSLLRTQTTSKTFSCPGKSPSRSIACTGNSSIAQRPMT